jgi:amino acid permease
MGFSPVVAICFTLNYVIGSGFLTLPWAFHQTGIIIGACVMLLFAFFSIAAIYIILESTNRAEICNRVLLARTMTLAGSMNNLNALNADQRNLGEYMSISDSDNMDLHTAENTIEEEPKDLPSPFSSSSVSLDTLNLPLPPGPQQFSFRKYELNEMAEIFLGKTGSTVYTSFAITYLYGTLWAYTAVFGRAFSTILPIAGLSQEYYSYIVYLSIFAVIVVPASLMEFSEQIYVQVCLTGMRVVMLLLMTGTIVFEVLNGDNEFYGETVSDHTLPTPYNRPFSEELTFHFDRWA